MTTTIMYTDLARSTALLGEVGDARYATLFTDHVEVIRRAVEANGGRIDKLLGDGVLARFDSAHGGVRAARSVQQSVELANRAADGAELAVRIGLAVGEVVAVGDDVYGLTLVTARRLCDQAAGSGDVVVTDLVRALLASRGDIEFEPLGTIELKGIAEPVLAWRVPWEPLPAVVPLRVAVADDATLIRSGVVRLLSDAGFTVTAEVDDGVSLIAAVDAEPPDLVITDIRMPPTHSDEGLLAAAEIRARHPGVGVLVLSQYVESGPAAKLLDGRPAGVGYLLKERVADLDEFIEACRSIAAGGSVIDPTIADQLLRARRGDSRVDSLSPREREVLALMAEGRSNQAISAELFVSGKTVETYVRSIFMKLELAETADDHRRVRAVLEWLRDGSSGDRRT